MLTRDDELTFLDAMLYAADGENPSLAIENQEKRGQQSVVRNQRLPKRVNETGLWNVILEGITNDMSHDERCAIMTRNNLAYTKSQYEKMGISILGEHDDLFYDVQLPEGWYIKATDHTMWNDLIDNNGRKRAQFFYKAAFYDRRAFINFKTRYHITVEHTAPSGADYDIWIKSDMQGFAKDGEYVIFSTRCVPGAEDFDEERRINEELYAELEQFMEVNYPDYKDINSYWD